ncbi:MAG: nucleotidyltransferase family protein [Bacteroidetes bacterium]|nr:nucleotidyltransferase family protein [Bacteroidota bacterium]MBU1422895.1 nucleotidyltransferase family protein [Bacteroidota bacterium]MBU2471581.1 nucleotidyltransferase family protein [Bacteroidota bacterium]
MKTTTQNKSNIFHILLLNKEKIFNYGARRLGLFGSFVRDEQKESSDIDFLVEFIPGKKTYDNFINLVYFLEELLGKEVELVTPESLSPYLKPYIEREIEYVSFTN